MALRSSPLEDSITYKTVIKSRQPKDRKPELPASYWNRNGGCRDMTATGECGGQVVTGFDKPVRCYWHAKVAAEPGIRLAGSLFVTNGTTDKMPPPQQTRKRAQHD